MDTRGTPSGSERKPQQEQKHPDRWQHDLNPDHMAGQNVGAPSGEWERRIVTAYDVKDVHRTLSDFANDDLKQIPILPSGARLEQGATYLDLADAERHEFKVNGAITVEPGHYYVPKDRVRYTLWSRLIGEDRPRQ